MKAGLNEKLKGRRLYLATLLCGLIFQMNILAADIFATVTIVNTNTVWQSCSWSICTDNYDCDGKIFNHERTAVVLLNVPPQTSTNLSVNAFGDGFWYSDNGHCHSYSLLTLYIGGNPMHTQ
jgi:hypothetical protein